MYQVVPSSAVTVSRTVSLVPAGMVVATSASVDGLTRRLTSSPITSTITGCAAGSGVIVASVFPSSGSVRSSAGASVTVGSTAGASVTVGSAAGVSVGVTSGSEVPSPSVKSPSAAGSSASTEISSSASCTSGASHITAKTAALEVCT